jgi:hypothetical protein
VNVLRITAATIIYLQDYKFRVKVGPGEVNKQITTLLVILVTTLVCDKHKKNYKILRFTTCFGVKRKNYFLAHREGRTRSLQIGMSQITKQCFILLSN